MLDANPLGDYSVHPRVDIPCDARDGPARHAHLRLEHGRRVYDDDIAFWFCIDRKLASARPISSTGIMSGTLGRTFRCCCCGGSAMAPATAAAEVTKPARGYAYVSKSSHAI